MRRRRDERDPSHGTVAAEHRYGGRYRDQKLLLARRLLVVLKERGPNGYPVGYDPDGHKVEWVPSGEDLLAHPHKNAIG
jgi:hypothetical protein